MTTSLSAAAQTPSVAPFPAGLAHGLSGVTRLTQLGVIRAVGAEAALFLQGQLTQDISGMGLNQARLAAFCNAKGRMQASFVVFKRQPQNQQAGDDILMVCSQDLLAQTLKRLSMFVMRSKVKLSDATADFSLYGLCGAAAESINAGDVIDAINAIDSGAASARFNWSKHDFDAVNVVQLYPGDGVARSLWCAPVDTPAPKGEALPLPVWQYLEVQSGIATISLPIFEAFVPQMLNYESVGGVNFKKGCYPGQEVVARSQFRGTLKRRAYLAKTAATHIDEPFVGQEVFHSRDAEQACGLVAACAPDPAEGYAVLVSMQTAAALPDDSANASPLHLGSSTGPALHLQSLPYSLLEDI